ncbi:oxidoreductase [Pseudaminobacter arsenicus]|uniref:Oxidoreductase n=1 Tax=Borborobacter arsenicus TaxID=1851146 RepID=A0A432VA84_9HYPH|nr:oxidoreductase [Pseudaminobacter arsenicus]RUM99003.1 oxidoreductase [Pseudaminobacter arsenicus]
MAPIPQPRASTVQAIYRAYEAANEHYDSLGISVGEIGNECDRALYYNLRWVSEPEEIDGRKLSIFRTGDRWEEVLVSDLERIGVEVFGQQDRIRLADGHIRGKCDGKAMGVVEAPRTIHLCEFKSSNDKGFKEIVKQRCKEARPTHYGQCQMGMHYFGLTRCLYLVVNKNDDARYAERIEYDAEWCIRQIARCERIIFNDAPPARLSEDPEFFKCRFCKHRDVCHGGAMPRVTCRSCIHASPERGGDAAWSCSRWAKPLAIDEQKAACPAHLYLPHLIDGEQIDCSEEEEWIEYRMRNGTVWRDGAAANDNTDTAA